MRKRSIARSPFIRASSSATPHSEQSLSKMSHAHMESALLHVAGAEYVGLTDTVRYLDVPPLILQGLFNEFVIARSPSFYQTPAVLASPSLTPEQARTLRGRQVYGVERYRFGYMH